VDRRRLGLTTATALVIANMIGAGVFTSSGFALADLGSRAIVLVAWLVGGVIALCGALSYSALLRRMPESGGEYYFLSRTVHPLAGFLAGWVSLLAGFTAPIAVAALALARYLGPATGLELSAPWTATGAILLAFGMHGLHLGRGVLLQNAIVALKLLLLLAFILLGLFHLPAMETPIDPGPPTAFDLGAFAVTLVWISFAYSGWNATAYIAGEVRNPERNATRSLWLGCIIVGVTYLLLNAVFVYSAPIPALAGKAEIGAIAAKALGGRSMEIFLSSIVALALFTSVSSMILIGPRVYARMATDGLFPRLFHHDTGIPQKAMALQALLAIAAVWISDLQSLLGYVGFTLGLSGAATVTALLHQRRKLGPDQVPIPGYPFTPAFYILATLAVSAYLIARRPTEASFGVATVLVGLPLYYGFRLNSRRGS